MQEIPEYREWRKAHDKEYRRQYYLKNKEKMNAQTFEYSIRNPEKIRENKIKSSKVYYEKNKEKLAAQKKTKKIADQIVNGVYFVDCPCGSHILNDGVKRHEKTKTHQQYLNKLKNPLNEK